LALPVAILTDLAINRVRFREHRNCPLCFLITTDSESVDLSAAFQFKA